MKILYISHLHPPKNAPLENIGGMQRVSIQLVKELNKRSDITVKTVIQHASWRGIELKTTFFLANLAYKLPHIVKEFEADIILFSSMVTASLARFTRNRIKQLRHKNTSQKWYKKGWKRYGPHLIPHVASRYFNWICLK